MATAKTASPTATNDDPAADAPATEGSTAAAPPEASLQPIPGSEVLGRGIYIRPRQPYELKDLLFNPEKGPLRVQPIASAARTYLVPPGCEVNDSPPLPADRATGQTIIEESWNRFGREVTLSANAAANTKAFSIDATAFQGSSLKAEDDSYYALRSSFIPFWSVYLPRADRRNVVDDFAKLDTRRRGGDHSDELHMPEGPYDPVHRADYARIFDRFGTHYVKSAWLGGKAALAFVVTKSSRLSKEDIKAGIETTFAGVAKGGVSTARSESQEQVRNNSTCNVFGSGGDPTELAKLTTLQPEQYDRWVASVKDNPEIIELGVAGIWTLLRDGVKAEALRQAYIEESTFTPLAAVVPFRDWLVVVKKDEVFDYALTTKYGPSRLYLLSCLFRPSAILQPEKLRERLVPLFEEIKDPYFALRFLQAARLTMPFNPALPRLATTPLKDVDAADLPAYLAGLLNAYVLNGESLIEKPPFKQLFEKTTPENFNARTIELLEHGGTQGVMLNRLLLDEVFGDELPRWPTRLSLSTYLPATEQYPAFTQPHAAFSMSGFGGDLEQRVYLFRWRQCLRINMATEAIDEGYPKNIADEWPDVDFDRIDAAVTVAPDRLYFFRGNEYIRLDIEGGECVGTTRDLIKNRWPGVVFDKIDTAAYWGSNKIYFFSGDQYLRYDFSSHRTDPGYPKFLSSNYVEDWEMFD